jgi:hypothetical protein
MTIAIGAICADAVLVASDSRTTNPDYTIRDNAEKVRLVRLAGPYNATIAHSGDSELGARIFDAFETVAAKTPLNDWQSVSDVGNKVIAEEQRRLRLPRMVRKSESQRVHAASR